MGKLLEPTFRPNGESKDIGNVCLELARRIGSGVSRMLPFKDTKDFVMKTISSIPNLGDVEVFRRKGLWIDGEGRENISTKRDPTVKIFKNDLKQEAHSPLPEYRSIIGHRKKQDAEFILTTFKGNLRADGTANSKWAREIVHENPLWMNKEAAKKLRIQNTDWVRVTSSVGSLTTRVLTTNRIHPESVALADGFGHTAVGNVAKARRFKSKDPDTNLIWWEKDGNGVNPNELIEARTDPESGGYALKDTVIRVEKL
jgi:anaerobic selenocysteine-containing dehydrogenase